ncbi:MULTISPECIES: class F sortase [unclassified Streptomyces]|uniref:class F sortase n=1 Tax=unclassified Streptomyces TaxID=2593676 RepID=UPI000DABDB86|nr:MULTISPECIES: class F sortase [unclassified Streptomyces]PZT76479.1 class F sortase [Streptomyces sp. AC1-42W]PZT79565.1 class F sortase [Streptomyces sp. AC1-42T]
MAAPQTSESPTPGTAAPTGPLSRALFWPLAVAGLGMVLIYHSIGSPVDDKPPAPPSVAVSAAASPSASAAGAKGDEPSESPSLPRSEPTRLRIPSIAVDAPFTPLSIGASGRLDAPPPNDKNLVGWFKDGPTPGELGTSIVAGHVDTTTGPAVFLQLRFLKPGATVDITRADGTVASFSVDSVETFSKADFPDDKVYADTPDAQLRLITCGGDYDRKAKDYEDNVVVFAHLDSVGAK